MQTQPQTPPSLPASLLVGRSLDQRRQLVAAFEDAWDTGVLAPERLRTGCLYETQVPASNRMAVMRFDPRRSGRRHSVFHEWRPELAPSVGLLHAYRHMDKHGQRHIQWPEFAQRYLAELEALPADVWLRLLDQFNGMSSRYTTVTLLCCEHATAGDEGRVRCHRRLLRAFLLGRLADLPELWRGAA